MFNSSCDYMYLLLQFGTPQKCSTVILPLSEGDNHRSSQFKTQLSTWSTTWFPGWVSIQVFHCSACSLEMVKDLAVLLQLGPCGSSDRFPHGHTFPNHVFRYSAPDKRSMQHMTHVWTTGLCHPKLPLLPAHLPHPCCWWSVTCL